MSCKRLLTRIASGLLILSFSVAADASGQTLLLLDNLPCAPACGGQPARLLEIDVAAGQLRSARPVSGPGSTMAVTADGRNVVWAGIESLPGAIGTVLNVATLLDRGTGQVSRIYQASWGVSRGTGLPFDSLVSDPLRARLFAVLDLQPPLAWDGQTTRTLGAGGPRQGLVDVSASGGVLLMTSDRDLVLLDVVAGSELTRWPNFLTSGIAFAALVPSGEEVFTVASAADARTNTFARRDALTGVALAEVTVPSTTGTGGEDRPIGLRSDPRSGDLWTVLSSGDVVVLDGQTLNPLRRLPTSLPAPAGAASATVNTGVDVTFDRNRPRAYVMTWRQDLSPSAPVAVQPKYEVRIEIVATDTLSVIGSGGMVLEGAPSPLVLVPTPPAPTSLAASVAGDRVTLQWQPGPGAGVATGYRLEAGSAPGAGGLAVFETTGTSLSVAGVPPGTYYVRVRATNYGGASDASEEIVVTIR